MLLSMDQLTRFFDTFGAKSDDHMPVIDIKYVHLWDGSPADEEHPLYIITASDLNKLSFTDDGDGVVAKFLSVELRFHKQ